MEVSGRGIYEPSVHPDVERPGLQDRPFETERTPKITILWRERRFLLGVAWKTAVLSAIVALLLPVHYKSIVKFVPSDNSGGMTSVLSRLAEGVGGGGSSAASGLGLDAASLLGVKTPGALYVDILASRTVQDRLIRRFDLQTHYWFGASRFRSLRGSEYNTRKKLMSFTEIGEDKKSNVITVIVTDYDKYTAAAIANAYVDEMNDLAAKLNTSDAHREREFLESRLTGAKDDLEQASQALSQFSSQNKVMDPTGQGKAMMDAAAKVQGELIASQAQLRGLEQIYNDENMRVRTLKARIAELQGQQRKLLGNSGTAQTTDSSGGAIPFSIGTLPLIGNRYADLYREAKIREAVYEFLTQQYELAKIKEAKELPTGRVMDPGLVAERKSSPIRSLIVILSVLGAIVLAAIWVVGKESWLRLPHDDWKRALAREVKGDLRAARERRRRKA